MGCSQMGRRWVLIPLLSEFDSHHPFSLKGDDMAIKSVYVCDNCGKEEVFKNRPIVIGNRESYFVKTFSNFRTTNEGLAGEQHFCTDQCVADYILKKKENE